MNFQQRKAELEKGCGKKIKIHSRGMPEFCSKSIIFPLSDTLCKECKKELKGLQEGYALKLDEVRNFLKNMFDDGFINNGQYTLILHNLDLVEKAEISKSQEKKDD